MILDATRPSVYFAIGMEWLPNGAKLRTATVQSSEVKLAEKPGTERIAFSAIKRDARSARQVELFRAIVRGGSERAGSPRAYGVTRAEFILIPRGAKYPRLRPRCMKIYDILVRLFVRPFAREIYSMHVI